MPVSYLSRYEFDDWIDSQKWDDLKRDLGDHLVDIVKSYLEDSQASILEVDRAFRRDDQVGLRKAVHSLKSTSGIVGIRKIVDLCNEIEVELVGEKMNIEEYITTLNSIYAVAAMALSEKIKIPCNQGKENNPGN